MLDVLRFKGIDQKRMLNECLISMFKGVDEGAFSKEYLIPAHELQTEVVFEYYKQSAQNIVLNLSQLPITDLFYDLSFFTVLLNPFKVILNLLKQHFI